MTQGHCGACALGSLVRSHGLLKTTKPSEPQECLAPFSAQNTLGHDLFWASGDGLRELNWQVCHQNLSGLSCVCKALYKNYLLQLFWPLLHSHTPFVIFPEEETWMNHLLSISDRLCCGTGQFAEQGWAVGIFHTRVVSVFHTALCWLPFTAVMQCSGISMDFQAQPQKLDTEIHPLCC